MSSTKDLSRDDLLILLSSMGIVLEDTKLSAEDLAKKLGQAFDASQQLSTHITGTTTSIDPTAFPPWRSPNESISERKLLFEASQRENAAEIHAGVMDRPKQGLRAEKKETFKEMRQSILGIAFMYDEDIPELFYVDESGKGIYVRILDVSKLTTDVPLFLFEYKEWVIKPGDPNPTRAVVPITDLERRALLKLFRRNAKKLHERYHTSLEQGGVTTMTTTFVLPLCPLNMQTLGRLTLNTGCQVCGKKETSRCLQCLSIAYCSKECQKKDWPEHKSTCKSLKGGTWSAIQLSSQQLLLRHRTIINRLDTLSSPSMSASSHAAGDADADNNNDDDIHKGKNFVAKFQISLSHNNNNNNSTSVIRPHMMIYDRQRSIQLWWLRDSDPKLFDQAKEMMGGQFKFYRWVRRVGKDKMEVCLDRWPAKDPIW